MMPGTLWFRLPVKARLLFCSLHRARCRSSTHFGFLGDGSLPFGRTLHLESPPLFASMLLAFFALHAAQP